MSLNLESSMPLPLGVILIDGNSGIVLEKRNIGSSYITGSGSVFDPDPGTYFRDSTLTAASNIDSAYKTNMNLTNLDGDGYVKGKYAESMNWYGPHQLAYNETNNFSYIRTQTYFKEVNIYYFINKVREYIGTLGISPYWQNGQAIEFDAVTDARYLYWGLSAIYYGTSDRIYFGYNPSSTNSITASDDLSVIIHEYGHALHDALISDGITSIPEGSDSEGIGEGIGDYLAISFRRTLPNGDYRPNEVSNYYLPNTRTSIKNSASANYSSWNNEGRYGKGAIWASALMDLEYNIATDPSSGMNLGRDVTTKLLLESLDYIPITASVDEYIEKIKHADIEFYSGIHLSAIEDVFNERGFYTPPAVPQNLDVTSNGTHPVVSWDANTEPDLDGYYVYRSIDGGSFLKTATLNNNITSWEDSDIIFTKPIWSVRIEYKAKAFDTYDNISDFSNMDYIFGKENLIWKKGVDNVEVEVIKEYALNSNYPNPFNPSTTISYQIPNDGFVSLEIYDISGSKVVTLVNEAKIKGRYKVKFDARTLKSGVYFCRINVTNGSVISFTKSRKMLLLK